MGRGGGKGEAWHQRAAWKGHPRGGTKQEGFIQGRKVEGTKWGKTNWRGLGMEPGVRKNGEKPDLITKGTRRRGDWSIDPGGLKEGDWH
jgi:hypothetical protein